MGYALCLAAAALSPGCAVYGVEPEETPERLRLTVLDATERRVVRVRLEEAGAESKAG